jgi:hypothetical protein
MQVTETKTKILTKKNIAIAISAIGLPIALAITLINYTENAKDAEARNVMMETMKTKGCVADGLLTGSGGDTGTLIASINRSQCQYLHRSIETWTTPPDFALIAENMKKIKKPGIIYSMFLAEAIGLDSKYNYPDGSGQFDFPAMCKNGSQEFWGPGTCKANFASKEYRKYLSYITKQAIDLGVQSFLIGQIYFQDVGSSRNSIAPEIISEMRQYAKSKGKVITIGAQTNDIEDPNYLKLFDYIEGGVGIDDVGNIENGACFSRWWKKPGDRCWALLWNEKFASKANNVILNFDWSGLEYDDMSKFARMNKSNREKTLKNLYQMFASRKVGFLMPFLAVVYRDNNGCYGPNSEYYSPDNKYSCKDEDFMNSVLQKGFVTNGAQFVSQIVPSRMIAGEKYQVSVTMKNIGTGDWSKAGGYRLGSQNPQDNNFWNRRVEFSNTENILPGQNKVFDFQVTAPATPGIYNFQWKMVQEGFEWFGGLTQNMIINIESNPNVQTAPSITTTTFIPFSSTTSTTIR